MDKAAKEKIQNRSTLAALFVIGVIAAAWPGSDPDQFLHLSAGREVASQCWPSGTETLTVLSEGRPFVNHEWLYDLGLYKMTDIFGTDTGILLFRMLLAGLLFMISGLAAVRLGANSIVTLFTLAAFIPLFRLHLEARPHVAGYMMAAFQLAIVSSQKRSDIFKLTALTITTVLWTNLHGSFPVAMAICGYWLLTPTGQNRNRKTRIAAMFAVGAAFCVNPWGPELLTTLFYHADPGYRALVPEWGKIVWGEAPAHDIAFLTLAAVGLLSFLPKTNRREIPALLIFLMYLAMATTSKKFELGLAAGSVPVMAANLSRWSSKRVRVAIVVTGAVMCVTLWPFVRPGLAGWGENAVIGTAPAGAFDLDNFPDEAVADMNASKMSGTIFCPAHLGGFIEWAASQDNGIRPFIDGRHYVHGLDGVNLYINALADYKNFKSLHSHQNFSAVLVEFADPAFPRLTAGLDADPEWDLIRLDSRFALFVPDDKAVPGMNEYRLMKASVDPRYLFDIDDIEQALNEAGRVLDTDGGMEAGLLTLGILRLAEAGLSWQPESYRTLITKTRSEHHPALENEVKMSCRLAAENLSRLVRIRPDVPMFTYFQGMATACSGECERSIDALESTPFQDARTLAGILKELCH